MPAMVRYLDHWATAALWILRANTVRKCEPFERFRVSQALCTPVVFVVPELEPTTQQKEHRSRVCNPIHSATTDTNMYVIRVLWSNFE
ncbi:hypothetical protein TNCV_1894671 [Trichonephila clavipes]|nr:hypothetical protein TNCV_1894671 [Trichonephila clavipes]